MGDRQVTGAGGSDAVDAPEQALTRTGTDLLVLGSSARQAGDGRLGAVVRACLRRPLRIEGGT